MPTAQRVLALVSLSVFVTMFTGCGSLRSEPKKPPPGPTLSEIGRQHYNLGVAFAERGDSENAIIEFHKAMETDPNDAKMHQSLGKALLDSGNTDAAIVELRRAIEIDPRLQVSHLQLADAYSKKGNVAKASEQYSSAFSLGPADASLHNSYGQLLRQRGDLDGAIAQSRAALDAEPKRFSGYISLADLLLEKGDHAEAKAVISKAMELSPQDALAHSTMGFALLETDPSAALTQWEIANKMDSRDADAMAGMSLGLWQMGLKDQAGERYREAAKINRDYICREDQLKQRGRWNVRTLSLLRSIRKQAGADVCRRS